MIDYTKVPVDYMAGGVERYIEYGVPPGSFLLALFSNDLKGAYRQADEQNMLHMRDWIMFMINEIPSHSQGSPEAVEAWIKMGGIAGPPP